MSNSYEYTCIFGGGAVRGIAYIGTVKAMEELGIVPTNLAGSSVGSIIAALLAVGYSSAEIDAIFMDVKFKLFRDIYIGIKKTFALSKGEVFTEWVRDLIEKKFYGDCYSKGHNEAVTFKDLKKNLTIITTDLTLFKYKEFSKEETPDFEVALAVRISSSMPGLINPFTYNKSKLVDGDLLKSWPLWKLSKNLWPDNGRVLEFRLEGNYLSEPKNPLDFINAVYSCVTSVATDQVIDSYAFKDKFDYIKINTGDILVVDFNASTEARKNLVNMGYEQTLAYFSKTLPTKKENLLFYYKELHKLTKNLSQLIIRNDIINSKIVLGDIFAQLCESKRFIDKKFYILLKHFRTKLLSSIQTSFFKKFRFENKVELIKLIDNINDELSEHIKELESYLKDK